jgi:initiation factor 1A
MGGKNKSNKRGGRSGRGGATVDDKMTRLANPEEPAETYAVVTHMYGNGMCGVICNDSVARMCVIRNKFRGRRQHRNRVSVGTRLLVGLRDWEAVSAAKKEKCDLLYVYDDCEVGQLRADKTVNWKIMKGAGEEKTHDGAEEQLFEFVLGHEIEKAEGEMDEVDIDDI